MMNFCESHVSEQLVDSTRAMLRFYKELMLMLVLTNSYAYMNDSSYLPSSDSPRLLLVKEMYRC